MGWKQIGNHSYYYRSRRETRRVVSEYIGGGKSGSLLARLDDAYRKNLAEQRAREKAEREAMQDEERAIKEWFDTVEIVATCAMLAAGFRKHHGQWRRTRNGESRESERAQAPDDRRTEGPDEDELG